MSFNSALLITLLIPASVWTQEVVTIDAMSQKPLSSDTEVLAFSVDGKGRDVTLLSPKPPMGMAPGPVSAKLAIWENGQIAHEHAVGGMLPAPIALGSSHLLFVSTDSKGIAGPVPPTRLMDIASGQVVTIFDDFRPLEATFGPDELVTVGFSTAGVPELRVAYGPAFGTKRSYPLPPGLLQGPLRHILSAGSYRSVVMLNMVEASFIVLDYSGGSLRVGNVRSLGGREISKSKDWPGGSGRPGTRRILVLAQASLANGGIIALLSPYRREDGGFRVAEYSATGSEVRSWRLKIPEAGTKIDLRPSTVAWTADQIVISTSSGLKRSYRRPS